MSSTGPDPRTLRRLIPLLGAAGLAAACANMPELAGDPPIDTTSPAARRVAAILAEPGRYPTFAEIPPVPAGAAPVAQDVRSVAAMLIALPAPIDATAETNAFAAQQQARLAGATTPTQADIDATEAFAAAARARATPPSTR